MLTLTTLLSVNNLTKVFGGLIANTDVSFNVNQNEIVGIIGPNGAGKTTCFNLISGFLKPSSGEVIFNGKDITKMMPYETASLGMTRTFQHTSVFSNLSVFESVMTGQHLAAKKLIGISLFARKKYHEEMNKQREKTIKILKLMGLLEKKDVIANRLPYGEQRKLEIAITLAANPKLLLLDEPAAGMNDIESANLVQIIKELKQNGISVLIVEHDMKVVMNLCDFIIVLDQGRKIAEGTPNEIRNNPQVIKVYLGESDYSKIKEGGRNA